MKIIFLEAAQNFGGSKRCVIDISTELMKAGHEVLIVDFWGANIDFRKAVEASHIPFQVLLSRKEPLVIKKGSKLNKFKNIIEYSNERMAYKRRFQDVVNSFQPDYVCVNTFKALDILSNSSSYKIDYYVRGWNIGNSAKSKFYLKKFTLRFIAISEATRHALYIQNGIPLSDIIVVKAEVNKQPVVYTDTKVNSNFSKENPINLLHAGTFIKTKGHHISVLVAHRLKEKGIPFKMKIAGLISVNEDSERYLNELKLMSSDLQVSDSIEFIVNNHNLSDEMVNTNILINPSFTEGLSRVCLEAMSHGKPVITNAVGGVTDFVIDNYTGYLVDFNNVDQYVECITKYYEDSQLLKEHGLNSINIINSGYLTKQLGQALNKAYPNN